MANGLQSIELAPSAERSRPVRASHYARVLAVVPAFNEARNLPALLARLKAERPEWDVVVVDDGSRDATAQVARRHGARVLELPFNLGIGGAVQTGLTYAARHRYDAFAQVDGDGQHDIGETGRLLADLFEQRADAMIGSRFLCTERDGFRSTFCRRVGIRVLAWLISRITGQTVTDPTSGQRVLGARAIALLASDYPQEYPEPEALFVLLQHHLNVKERAVVMYAREHGASSIGGVRSLLYMLKVVLAILVRATSLPTAPLPQLRDHGGELSPCPGPAGRF